MVFIFALVPWLGLPISYVFIDKEQDILEQYLANVPDIGFFGIVAAIICLLIARGAVLDLLDHKIASLIGGAGLVFDILCLTVFSHMEGIADWFKINGLAGNAVWLAVLLAVIFVNFKFVQAAKTLKQVNNFIQVRRKGEEELVAGKVDGVEISVPVTALLGIVLIIPSVVMYIFDDFADLDTVHMSRLVPNLDVLHWSFAVKIFCILFIIILLKYLLPIIRTKSFLGWFLVAMMVDIAAVSFLYVLLERVLYPIAMEGLLTKIFIYFPMLVISGFFHYYAYIFFLYCLFNFISPGAIRQWRRNSEAAALAKARVDLDKGRASMEEKLDAEERLLNALDGVGPFTNEEALARGSISTEEYIQGKIYREQKLDR